MFLEQVGRELKSIRARNGWTLEKAQEITGIHKNTLSIYENNPDIIQLGKIFKIVEDYGVDIDIFFRNVSENTHKMKIEKEN